MVSKEWGNINSSYFYRSFPHSLLSTSKLFSSQNGPCIICRLQFETGVDNSPCIPIHLNVPMFPLNIGTLRPLLLQRGYIHLDKILVPYCQNWFLHCYCYPQLTHKLNGFFLLLWGRDSYIRVACHVFFANASKESLGGSAKRYLSSFWAVALLSASWSNSSGFS